MDMECRETCGYRYRMGPNLQSWLLGSTRTSCNDSDMDMVDKSGFSDREFPVGRASTVAYSTYWMVLMEIITKIGNRFIGDFHYEEAKRNVQEPTLALSLILWRTGIPPL